LKHPCRKANTKQRDDETQEGVNLKVKGIADINCHKD